MPAYVTNKGMEIIARRIKGEGTQPLYIGWGTGAGNASPTSTVLFTEAAESRCAGNSSIITVSTTYDTYKVTGVLMAAADKTITNWGLFDAISGGNMLAHESIVPGQDLTLGQMLAFVFRFQFARG